MPELIWKSSCLERNQGAERYIIIPRIESLTGATLYKRLWKEIDEASHTRLEEDA